VAVRKLLQLHIRLGAFPQRPERSDTSVRNCFCQGTLEKKLEFSFYIFQTYFLATVVQCLTKPETVFLFVLCFVLTVSP
jgi:hypothetical protein